MFQNANVNVVNYNLSGFCVMYIRTSHRTLVINKRKVHKTERIVRAEGLLTAVLREMREEGKRRRTILMFLDDIQYKVMFKPGINMNGANDGGVWDLLHSRLLLYMMMMMMMYVL